MKKLDFSSAIGFVSKAGLKLKKHSPEILVVSGVIGMIGTVVTACKATTKIDAVIEEAKEKVDQIHDISEREDMAQKYNKQDRQRDLTIVYTQTAVKFAKLYWIPIVLGITSTASILAGHGILKKRNAALAAAYAAIDTSFKDYRGRVIERFGEKVDYELKHGIKAEKVSEALVTDENGNQHVEQAYIDGQPAPSGYAKIFDETNPHWERDSDYNQMFLVGRQKDANNKLRTQRYLFLNEVYSMLGFPETKAGQVVGWIYDPDDRTRDNYIDFGLFDPRNGKAKDFINGFEKSVILDFNVDGVIYDKFEEVAR